jgi:ATP-dependent DNA ligase
MLCTSVERVPEGEQWQYELKLDSYRAIGFTGDSKARLWSRNGKDFVGRFPEVAKALPRLPEDTAIDGEIVALDTDGKPVIWSASGFQRDTRRVLRFRLADVVWQGLATLAVGGAAGESSQGRGRLAGSDPLADTFDVPAAALIQVVRENGLEGVAKRTGSTYRSGRSGDWVKWRANRDQEFVIGGYVPASSTFDSLLVGYFEGRELMYAGRIRAGLVPASRRALFPHFAKLMVEDCPFRNLPERTKGRWGEGLTAKDMHKCRWLAPRLVAVAEFLEWTPQLRLRHPRFVGLRTDKDPNEVVRE